MPFTVSHAAAVLPFRKLNLIWSAFIVGSMAPDFPYILGTTDYRFVGHIYPGLLKFTLPASFAALWLFHNVIKRPVVGLFPVGIQQRLSGELGGFKFGGISRFLAILASIVLGIATHLVWDAFTHPRSWPWHHIAFLRGRIPIPGVGSIPTSGALQYISSIGGAVALAVWVWLWYRRTATFESDTAKPFGKSHFPFALAMLTVAVVAGLLRASVVLEGPLTFHNADHFLLLFGVTSLALAFWQLLFYCVLVSSHQVWTIT